MPTQKPMLPEDLLLFKPHKWQDRNDILKIWFNILRFLDARSLASIMQQPVLKRLIINFRHFFALTDCKVFGAIISHMIRFCFDSDQVMGRNERIPVEFPNTNVSDAVVVRNRNNEHIFTAIRYGIFEFIHFKYTKNDGVTTRLQMGKWINEDYQNRLLLFQKILENELQGSLIRVRHLKVDYWSYADPVTRLKFNDVFHYDRLN